MTRREILETAIQCVCTDRETQYGAPEDNLGLIAQYLSVYLKDRLIGKLDAHDIGMFMTLLKVARIQSGQAKADNYVDGAGYLALAGEIREKLESKADWGDTD